MFSTGEPEFVGELELLGVILREKFVQWRIEGSDRGGQPFESPEDAGKVLSLIGQQFRESFGADFLAPGKNHFPHRIDAVALKEHMLCSAETDTFGSESHGVFHLIGRIRISTHPRGFGTRSTHVISLANC